MKHLALHAGDFVDERWKIVDKLGEGGCGKVYAVINVKDGFTYAMKIESTKTRRFHQLLKTEAQVLRKIQFSAHVPTFLCCDRTNNFRFLVMELLGESLNDYQKKMPQRRFSVSTTLRIGLQALQAIWDVHRTYYVHRDIKPSNFAVGLHPNHRRVYLFDFGLSRSLLDLTSKTRRLRVSRHNIAFRGTVNYCSPNVHDGLEHGRHDDLWSLLYMCIEMIRGYLPWHHLRRKKAALLKREASDQFLLLGCPTKFKVLLQYFRRLRYHHHPDYVGVYELFKSCIVARNINENDPLDWETSDGRTAGKVAEESKKSTYLMPLEGAKRSEMVRSVSHDLDDGRLSLHFSVSSLSDSSSTRSSLVARPLVSEPSNHERMDAMSANNRIILNDILLSSLSSSSFSSSPLHDVPSTPTCSFSLVTLPLSSPTSSLSHRTDCSYKSLPSLDGAFATLSVSTAHVPTTTELSEKSSSAVSNHLDTLSTCRPLVSTIRTE